MRDPIFDIIDREFHRQKEGLELIASENFVSQAVLEAMGSCLTNKYAEGLPGKRYYGGCHVVDEAENLARDRAKQLFGAEWCNVQPHSGSQANFSVMFACLQPGDKILGFNLSHGGHLTHGSPVNFSGKLYHAAFYGVEPGTGRIDFDKIRDIALQERPKLIIAGASAYARDWDYATMRLIADEVGALLMADIAHPAGLIAAGLLNDPMPHCHVVTTTTHKTLRGPRGGLIMMGKDFDNPYGKALKNGTPIKMSALIDGAVFPGAQGGPLMHVIASKAVAFGEALQPAFKLYARQVIRNAQTLAEEMMARGYKVISDGTDNHLILVDLRNKGLTGKIAENALVAADITVNKNMVPFDTESPFVTSGIRIGSAAVTSRGLREDDMRFVAAQIHHVLQAPGDEAVVARVRAEVHEKMNSFPLQYAPVPNLEHS